MSLAEAIREMMANGAAPEEIGRMVAGYESAVDKRSAHAKRQERYRRHKASQSVTSVTPSESVTKRHEASQSVTDVTPLARVEDNNPSLENTGKKKNSTPTRHAVTPREYLLECLSPESADGVLAHRKAMRRPLTGRAAQLLAKGFLATADPNAAADMMIERGWQGFRPEWFDNERRSNGKQQQGKGSIVEAGRRLTARLIAAEREGEMQAERGFREGDDAFRVLPGGLGKRS